MLWRFFRACSMLLSSTRPRDGERLSMDLALRPMSTSQVLDRTFHLYRNNFVLFAGIALIAPALSLIAALLQLWLIGPAPPPPEAITDPEMASRVFSERSEEHTSEF